MAPEGARTNDKNTGDAAAEAWQLVRDYAKQETIDPLKSIGRFLAYGLAGAVLFSVGMVFGVLALLRILQEETGSTFTGSLNVVPYVVALLFSVIVIAVCARAITKPNRTGDR